MGLRLKPSLPPITQGQATSRSRLWCLRSNEARQATTRALASSANVSLWVGATFLCGWDHPRRGEPSTCTRTSDFLEHHYATHDTTEQTSKKLPTSGSEAQTSAFSFSLCLVPCYSLYTLEFHFQEGSSCAGRLLVLSDLRPSSVSWQQPPCGFEERPRPLVSQTAGWRVCSGPRPDGVCQHPGLRNPGPGSAPRLGQPALFPGTLHRCQKAVGRDTEFEKRGIWGHCSHVPHHVEHE